MRGVMIVLNEVKKDPKTEEKQQGRHVLEGRVLEIQQCNCQGSDT